MAFNYQNFLSKKKRTPWQADPSKLTTTTARRQPSYTYDYQRTPSMPQIPSGMHGQMQIRRQTTEQSARPRLPAFTRGPRPPVNPPARMFRTIVKPAGFDPTASQFPWEMRRGISSDVSRQRAFRLGFGSGEGRTGFARRATDVFFDPRFMFDPNFRRWALQQKTRRRYGL